MILPSQGGAVPVPGVIEGGLVLGAVGLFSLAVFRGLSKASLVPLHEPIAVDEAYSTA
jgi:hypothetical protein